MALHSNAVVVFYNRMVLFYSRLGNIRELYKVLGTSFICNK